MRSKASIAGIVAGAAIAVLGIAAFVLFLVARLSAFSAALQRFGVPGEAVLKLKAGPHTVYWESKGLRPVWPDFECSIESPSTNRRIELSRSWISSRYSFEGRRGVSVFVFEAPEPGAYRFQVRARERQPVEAGGTMAVRPGGWGEVVVTVLGCLLILGGSIAAGVLLILRAALGGRSRRAG